MKTKIGIHKILIAFLILSSNLWAQGRISVIGVMEPNAPTLTKTQSNRLKQTIRSEVERMQGFFLVEDDLMRSILEQQGIEGSCENDLCYFGVGSLMGTEFLVGCNMVRASGNNFSGEIVLFNISRREVVNRISFNHTGDFNSFIQNQVAFSVREVFRARIKTISSNVQGYRVNLGEEVVLDYSFTPSNAIDDIVVRIPDPSLLRRVDRRTLATIGQGTTFIELYSAADPSVSTRVEVRIEPRRNVASQEQRESRSFRAYIMPYAVSYAMYHGPAGGLGIGVGMRFGDESAHYFGLEVEKAILPKDLWWFKENRVLGWAFVYAYGKPNQKSGWSISPGISLGNREFYTRHYFSDRINFIETTINYYWSPFLKIQRGGFTSSIAFMPNFNDFMGHSSIKISSGYRFSF